MSIFGFSCASTDGLFRGIGFAPGVKLPRLVTRRQAEAALFQTPSAAPQNA